MSEEKKDFMDKFRKELEEDAFINEDDLAGDLARIVLNQSKWVNHFNRFKDVYIRDYKALKTLKAVKYKALITGTEGFVATRSEAKYLVEGDKEVVDLEERLEKMEMAMEFFEEAQKIVRDKGFVIGNIIRLKEFEAGMG